MKLPKGTVNKLQSRFENKRHGLWTLTYFFIILSVSFQNTLNK